MSEDVLTQHIQEILESLKEDAERLEQNVKAAEDRSVTLMALFFKSDEYLEFEFPDWFWMGITELSEQVGYAQHMVLEIENKRAGIPEEIEKGKTNPVAQAPVVVHPTPAVIQQPGGVAGWLGERTRAKSAEKIQKLYLQFQAKQETPKIATEHQVTDILEFGRQLIPEFNRLHLYFQQCLDHLYCYSDDATKRYFHGELRQHLFKLVGIIRSFCRTVAEYRKTILDNVKMELAKGMTEVVTARLLSEAKIPLNEIFAAIRQERPSNF